MAKAKVLILDIENFPHLGFFWTPWEPIIPPSFVKEEGYVGCWSAKWLGESKIYCDALPYHKTYYRDHPKCDKRIVKSIWKLLDEADIVVGHNVKQHDLGLLNAAFVGHDLFPPSPYKIVDTYLSLGGKFKFLSKKLEYLVKKFKLDEKLKHEGWGLWLKCMAGDKKSWETLTAYCQHDTRITEKLYLKLRPYFTNHPNLNLYSDSTRPSCEVCGSNNVQKRGTHMAQCRVYPRFQCKDCGKWFHDRKTVVKELRKVK